jgi:hypothetical protein
VPVRVGAPTAILYYMILPVIGISTSFWIISDCNRFLPQTNKDCRRAGGSDAWGSCTVVLGGGQWLPAEPEGSAYVMRGSSTAGDVIPRRGCRMVCQPDPAIPLCIKEIWLACQPDLTSLKVAAFQVGIALTSGRCGRHLADIWLLVNKTRISEHDQRDLAQISP